MTRCLLVDDDAGIRGLLPDYLGRFGLAVDTAADGAGLRTALNARPYDLLLLDLMLPDANGLDLCQWVKRSRPMPVIMLTAQGDPMSRVVGLELGADDYLPKPFEPRELVARIKAVLRRGGDPRTSAPAGSPPMLRFGGWTFDRLRRQLLSADGVVLALSAAEFRLLLVFVEHAGSTLSRERLLQLTRAPGVEASDRSIDLAVSRLRQKLGDPLLIRTLRGEGYLFDPVGGR